MNFETWVVKETGYGALRTLVNIGTLIALGTLITIGALKTMGSWSSSYTMILVLNCNRKIGKVLKNREELW